MALNVLMGNSFKDEFDETILVRIEVADDQHIYADQPKFFLALYVQKKSPTLNVARCAVFRQRKKPPPPTLKNQAPTDCNTLIDVHGQCQLWNGVDTHTLPVVDISVRGWEMKDGVTTPVIYAAPNAPQKLLDMVICQCGIHFNKTCTTGRCGIHFNKTCTTGRCGIHFNNTCTTGRCGIHFNKTCTTGRCGIHFNKTCTTGRCGIHFNKTCTTGRCGIHFNKTCTTGRCGIHFNNTCTTGRCGIHFNKTCTTGRCGIHFNKTCTTGRCSAENLVSHALAKYCACDRVKMEKTRMNMRVWLFWQHQYEIGDVVDQLANLVYKWRKKTFWLTGWAYHAISGVDTTLCMYNILYWYSIPFTC